MSFQYRTVGINDNLVLNAWALGNGHVDCVLIHGFGDSSAVWRPLAKRLAKESRVVAFDLRGHGDSGWDRDARYDVSSHTSDLLQVLDSFSVKNVVLIGHSLGAEIALRAISSGSVRAAGLVLVDFGPEMAPDGIENIRRVFREMPRHVASVEEFEQWLRQNRPLADLDTIREFASHSLRRLGNGTWEHKADPSLAESLSNKSSSPDGRCSRLDLWSMLSSVACPTLVVRGLASSVLPNEIATEMVKRALPQGSLVVLPAGHAVMMDDPIGFGDRLEMFLGGIIDRDSGKTRVPN